MFIRILLLTPFMLYACTSPITVIDDSIKKDDVIQKDKTERSDLEKQSLLEKRRLALIETGDPDSIMDCVAGEDSQSISDSPECRFFFRPTR